MKLLVHELKTESLYQEVVADKNMIIAAIRPHLYLHNNPTGSLKIQILDLNNELITESEVIDMTTITSALYFHGYVRFYTNFYVKKDTSFRMKLVSSSYTFSESSYVGWCNGYDLKKYPITYTPDNDFYQPLDFEIWARNP